MKQSKGNLQVSQSPMFSINVVISSSLSISITQEIKWIDFYGKRTVHMILN